MIPPEAAEAEAAFFVALGERVRGERARRGMSRKLLARDSGVSERHLAEIESGRGNASLAVLRRIARALNVAVADLVREGTDPGPAYLLLDAFVRGLAPDEQRAAHALLVRRHGRAQPDRTGRIALIGLRGAGKSALGARLARARGVPFVELDAEIRIVSGLAIETIFDVYGQAGFRRFEREALEAVLGREQRFVMATSGSIVSTPDTFGRLLSACYTIWLRADPGDHMRRVVEQGDMRPMAGNGEAMADLERILGSREAMYGRADAIVETSGRGVEQAAAELAARTPELPK